MKETHFNLIVHIIRLRVIACVLLVRLLASSHIGINTHQLVEDEGKTMLGRSHTQFNTRPAKKNRREDEKMQQ